MGGGGSGTQKIVFQEWPKSRLPSADFIFSTMKFGSGVRRGVQGATPASSCGSQPF